LYVHVIAHPDDDLYFLAPDLSDAIGSNTPVVTIVVTAGQLNGAGSTDGERARNRQRGLMDGYATMAGLSPVGDQSEWVASAPLMGGRKVDCFQIAGRPVTLVFMGLPDGNLSALDSGATLTTIPADGAPVTVAQTYTRSQAVATLASVINMAGPDMVRALDPMPESRYQADHPDHVTSAKLAADAVNVIPSLPPLTNYRTYTIKFLPANLTSTVEATKRATAAVYEAYDPYAHVGDWAARMRRRWPIGSQWVAFDSVGRLCVFTVARGRLWCWTREAGGVWTWPADLGNPGSPLMPGVAVGRNADGRLEVFARTADHRIVHRWQTLGGPWSTSWGDLSNHNAGGILASQMGSPIVMTNADGRLQIAVRNGGGGVSSRWQTAVNNGWSNWGDLGGSDVQDGLTASASADGRIELFAPTRAGVLHWYQTSPNGAMVLNSSLPAVAPASELHAVRGFDGLVRLASRRSGGSLAVTRQTAVNNGWAGPAAPVGGPLGYGPIVLAASPAKVYAYTASPGGVITAPLGPDGSPGLWLPMDGPTDAVTAVTSTAGQVELVGLGSGGHPHYWTGTAWVSLP
jgi:LmbE family N-acetylglucosaminyl deacetylase